MKLLDDRAVRWLLVPAIVFVSQTISDAYLLDFWHHLARGREIVNSGRLLDHDIFTYTVADVPFQDVNWGSQVVYYSLWRIGGLGLVRIMNALVLAGAWMWLVAICRRASGSLEAAVIVGLLAFLGSFQVLTIRPQTFSILLFVALMDVLLRAERDVRWLWWTLPIMAAWPNLHGAFPAGLILVGISWLAQAVAVLGERRGLSPPGSVDPIASTRPAGTSPAARLVCWTLALFGCVLATLVNPYGWEIYRYVGGTSDVSVRRGIDEWLPPAWDQWAGVAFLLSLPIAILLILFLLIEARRLGVRETFRENLLLVSFPVFFVMAARAMRMVVWWFLILAPILAVRLVAVFPRLKVTRYEPNVGATVSVFGLLGVCLLCLPPLHAINPLTMLRPHDPTTERLQAARDFMTAEYGGGRLFAQLAWGEYMSWAASPEWKIFMDGRIEIIPDGVWETYVLIMHGEAKGMEAIRRYKVDTLLLDGEKQAGLCRRVEESGEWQRTWEAGNVVVYRRVGSPQRP